MNKIKIYSDSMIERFYRKSNIVQLCYVTLESNSFYICFDFESHYYISMSLEDELIIHDDKEWDEKDSIYNKILEIRDNESYDDNVRCKKVLQLLLNDSSKYTFSDENKKNYFEFIFQEL